MYIPRRLSAHLKTLFKKFPILALNGPRQSGKSTLVKHVFPEKPYINLEAPDVRETAMEDPRGFLARYPDGAIFDEAQRFPELFSYLQEFVDEDGRMGLFILTGSQQFGLKTGITQSLAGRVAMTTLLPFETEERRKGSIEVQSLNEELFRGGYPPIYDRNMDPGEWFPSYVETYLERDVRNMLNVKDLRIFQRFLKLCSGRVGQLLNYSALSAECGVSYNTIKEWISVLEASYLIYLLPPYHRNFKKRLVKTPKLYFYDTGLAAWLIGIRDVRTLAVHPMRGALFECFIINEILKREVHSSQRAQIYFFRDRTGNEVDLIYENSRGCYGVEIKSGITVSADHHRGLKFWKKLQEGKEIQTFLVYGGDQVYTRNEIHHIPWKAWPGENFLTV